MRRRRLVWTFVAVVAVLFLLGNRLGSVYIDWLWFKSLGYTSVFWATFRAQWLVALAGGILFGAVTFFNLWLARGGLANLPLELVPEEWRRWFWRRRVSVILAAAAALVAFVAGLSVGSQWLTVLRFLHAQPYGGAPDPLFHRDAGFYVFRLPFWLLVYHSLSSLFFFNAVLAGGLYFVGGFVQYFAGRVQLHPRARAHLAGLVAAFFLLKAWGYALAADQLVYSTRGATFGAGYTDVHAVLPALRVLTAISLVVAGIAAVNAFRPALRAMAYGVLALGAASVLLGTAWPALLQEFVVRPNEIARETPYIRYDITFTRRAYGLDAIRQSPFPAVEDLTAEDVSMRNPTIANIRLWDWRVLGQAYQQLQGLRSYYEFDEMDVDRYTIDGQLKQVLLAAREINYDRLPGQTWINRHIKYTHGYGVAASPAADVAADGFPRFWVQDVPPEAQVPELRVERPEIYYGELTKDYVIVGTRETEFDYPKGETNAYTRYRGTGGVPIGPILNRLAFSLDVQSYNVLFSTALTKDSRALIYRDIASRVERIAPYLLYDKDPYIVISNGRLVWIQDAYTVTRAFPYAEPAADGFNYIRNSVKVTVDAYNGDVRFYVADPSDPLIRAYAAMFPGLFRPLSDMPADLRAHLRYPEYLFDVQGQMYAKYHMTDPQVFYNREDLWQVAKEIVGQAAQDVEPYYAILELPGESRPEFILLRPYTPRDRTNMVAWLGARSDPDHYGQLIAFLFPKDKNVLGPQQVESTISSTPEISQSLTLWNQQGSQASRGNLLVIPIRDSLLYVEPLYLQGSNSPLPRLQRVIVAYDNQVAMAPTLEQALASIFGEGVAPSQPGPEGPPAGPAPGQSRVQELAARAAQLYQEAQDALRAGDFATYGQRIQALGEVLHELQAVAGGAGATAPGARTPGGTPPGPPSTP